MRYLLDKVIARGIVRSLVKRSQKQQVTREEIFMLDLFWRGMSQSERLFIVPATANILQHLAPLPEYSVAINLFLSHVEVAVPTRYYTRWARRLRGYAFTREDAAVLALATFGMDQKETILGMSFLVTLDQPMINNWSARQKEIQKRLNAMQRQIPYPYSKATLPQILRPEQIVP